MLTAKAHVTGELLLLLLLLVVPIADEKEEEEEKGPEPADFSSCTPPPCLRVRVGRSPHAAPSCRPSHSVLRAAFATTALPHVVARRLPGRKRRQAAVLYVRVVELPRELPLLPPRHGLVGLHRERLHWREAIINLRVDKERAVEDAALLRRDGLVVHCVIVRREALLLLPPPGRPTMVPRPCMRRNRTGKSWRPKLPKSRPSHEGLMGTKSVTSQLRRRSVSPS